MVAWKIERVAEGQYFVRDARDSRRLGFVVGGGRLWCAEVGPTAIGYYPSRAAACRAVAAHAGQRA